MSQENINWNMTGADGTAGSVSERPEDAEAQLRAQEEKDFVDAQRFLAEKSGVPATREYEVVENRSQQNHKFPGQQPKKAA